VGEATGINRRAFLKLSAAFGAACFHPPAHPATSIAPRSASAQDASAASGLSIASTCPLPFSHHRFPNAESLLTRRLAAFDLLLVPAYAAAELIRGGALQKIPGSPGRAHDPDGAFTIPYSYAITALVYRGTPPASLDNLWTHAALWPDAPRLVIGTALLRSGYRLNDANPGHLAQVEEDLLRLRPRLVPDPLAGLRSGRAALALASIPDRIGEGEPPGIFLPPEGVALIEYDWVIPLNAPHPQGALTLITNLQPRSASFRGQLSPISNHTYAGLASTRKLIPLAPLPAEARALYAETWARIKETART